MTSRGQKQKHKTTDTGYSILKTKDKDYPDLVTVVGNLLDACAGSVLLLDVLWKMGKKYGRQFSVNSYEEILPVDVYGMEQYLGSDRVKGIGHIFAKSMFEATKQLVSQ